MIALRFEELTTDEVRACRALGRNTALVPVGSVEPHGPHLPLGTDTTLSEEAAVRATRVLREKGIAAFVLPSVPYGVTDYAGGFPGALSVPASALTPFLEALVRALLGDGFDHVCLVNNHLEPAHDAAVRASIAHVEPGRASVACPLTRRWAKTLSDEFKRGECHAGRYETSLVLAAAGSVREEMRSLPPVPISLSDNIRRGKTTFREMGIERAYTGTPHEATREEGDALYEKLVTMIVTEIEEGLARIEASPYSVTSPASGRS